LKLLCAARKRTQHDNALAEHAVFLCPPEISNLRAKGFGPDETTHQAIDASRHSASALPALPFQ
jgi:hypothetical protein